MRRDRYTSNKEILNYLKVLTEKFPDKNFEALIKEFVIGDLFDTFFEESIVTLKHLKIKMQSLGNLKSRVPATINSLCLEKLGEIIDIFPDQRFGQICSNYLFNQYESPIQWLYDMDRLIKKSKKQ